MKLECILNKGIYEDMDERGPGTMYDANEANLKRLKEALASRGGSFILGAGVSIPFGIASWNKLLAKMWARILEFKIEEGEKAEKAADSPEDAKGSKAARYRPCVRETKRRIRTGRSDGATYREKVSRALDGGYEALFQRMNVLEVAEYIRNYIKDLLELEDESEKEMLMDGILNDVLKDSMQMEKGENALLEEREKKTALEEVALFLVQTAGEVPCNVITYNYDNLLEFLLKRKARCPDCLGPEVICGYDSRKMGASGKITIYHPHGYLKLVEDGLEKADTEKVILTESSYYGIEQKVYRWENSIQANAFLNTTCVFIGFSGQDYNFRRMIKNIAHDSENGEEHFMFFCVDELVEGLFKEEAERRLKKELLGRLLREGKSSADELNSAWEQEKDSSDYRKRKAQLMTELISEDEFAYERVQLIYLLYAQYSYWTRHNIIPIWSTFEELPDMIHRLYS